MSTSLPDDAAPALRVKLLWLPEAMPGTLFGALDVLRAMSRIAHLQQPELPARIGWQIVSASGRAMATPFAPAMPLVRQRGRPVRELLFVPSLLADNAPGLGEIVKRSPAALRLVRRHAADGGWVAACTTGMAIVAGTGLLDGGRVSAPWAYQSWLSRAFPHCDFSSTDPFGAVGRCFTCVAPSLLTEFMLRVLGHVHDPDLAHACSQLMLHQPQRQQITPALVDDHWLTRTNDSPVYRAIQWLQSHVDQTYRLDEVARAAAVSPRTLLRQFRQVTGMTPLDHLHRLRIERAKTLLEVTLHGIPAIAEACGYHDVASFRRLFQRETGMAMSAYRARFTLRTRRTYWRVESRTHLS